MKKLLALPVLTALLMMLACDKVSEETVQETPNTPETEQLDLTPIVFQSKAADDTRVAIDGYDLKFSVGENIAVASYDYTNETSPLCSDYATFDDEGGTITEPSASGKFIPQNEQYGNTWASTAHVISFYSYYPTTAAAPSITGTTATVSNIAATQDGTVNNIVCWAKGSNIASSDEVKDGKVPSFSYSPVCALLKLNIVNNTPYVATSISNITFTAGSGNIAGSAALDLITGKLTGGSSSTISYTPESALEISAGGNMATIYFAFIPAAVGSLDIALTDSRGATCSFELNKDMPTSLLPGRLYERTLSINSIIKVSGSLGTYNGVKFARGFLKRTDNTSTNQTNMRISDATVNPMELLTFMNYPESGSAWNADAQQMYFSRNELKTIFTGSNITNFSGYSITLNEKTYSVPTTSNYQSLFSTTRESNTPSINGSNKAWALVMVTLSDSNSAFGVDYTNKGFESANSRSNYLRGFLFFPDGASVICGNISAEKCNTFNDDVYGSKSTPSPNTITSSQLKALIVGGCLFLPLTGGQNGGLTDWISRGNAGLYWGSTTSPGTIWVFTNEDYAIVSNAYGQGRHFPVALVEVDSQ